MTLVFLKLGGSLITDKTQPETIRPTVLARVAREIKAALTENPDLKVVLGHGSGSFGHVAAASYGTRQGVHSAEQWAGFAEVSDAATRLNAIVRRYLLDDGISAISLSPSASAECEDGTIRHIALQPIQKALAAGLLPIIYGDVAFDSVRGGTIISTEEVMTALAATLQPTWLLLAGETDGVYDAESSVIPAITRANLPHIRAALGGSRGTDVTGGMLTKVLTMLDLVDAQPGLSIRIFSGLQPGAVQNALREPHGAFGTLLSH
ncbi:MAG: isopentenyl phosphate kinase [Anaerolineae bacterium]|nr:isopentenyl phosphate kinase [Anaerolineae bacterium]